ARVPLARYITFRLTSISKWLSAGNYSLYSLKCFPFPTQGDESLTFQVQEILLADLLRRRQVATTHHMSDLARNLCVMIGDVIAFTHAVYASQEQRETCPSLYFDVVRLDRHRVSRCSHVEHSGFRVSKLTVDVHGNPVAFPQNFHAACFRCGKAYLRSRDRHERVLQRVELNVAFLKSVAHTLRHFLRTPAGRYQAHPNLNETDVCFSRGLHPVGVQRDLASASDRTSLRTHDNRNTRVTRTHDRTLELPDHKLKLIVILLDREHKHQAQVGA